MQAFITSTPLSLTPSLPTVKTSTLKPTTPFTFKPATRSINHHHAYAKRTTPSMVSVRGSSSNPYRIAVLSGDGAGPAVASAVKRILSALETDADLHFDFIDAPYGQAALTSTGSLVPDQTLDICRSADAVLRSYQGTSRGPASTSAHIQLRDKLGLFAQFRPVIVYPQLRHLSTLREDVIRDVDIMLVREISAGALASRNAAEGELTSSTIEYTVEQVEAVADMALEVAKRRSGRIFNVDKSDAMSISRFWRRVLHERLDKTIGNDKSIMLQDMYVDDFVREVIHRPCDFDVVVTSNLFGDICAEVIDALAGPQRLSPSFWKGKDGLGVYGPADIYNLEAYPSGLNGSDGPSAIAMTRAASMMLRYELDEPAAANTIQRALRKTMADVADDVAEDDLLINVGVLKNITTPLQDIDEGSVAVSSGGNSNGNSSGNDGTGANYIGDAKKLVNAFSKTSADDYADVIVRSMQLLRQFEQVCDPTECGE